VTVDLPWPLRVRTCLLDRAFGNDRLRREGASRPAAAQGQLATQLARRADPQLDSKSKGSVCKR
jgi:hypothetical protein